MKPVVSPRFFQSEKRLPPPPPRLEALSRNFALLVFGIVFVSLSYGLRVKG